MKTHRPSSAAADRRRVRAAEAIGFRRVDHVVVIVEAGHAVAEVTGIVHRYPRTVRVPLSAASRLVAAGVPWQLVQRR